LIAQYRIVQAIKDIVYLVWKEKWMKYLGRRIKMCEFFSLLSNGKGQIYYFDYSIRKQIISGKSKYKYTDSHTSIADHFKLNEDKMNKWEYNPLTQNLVLDQLNAFRNDESKVLNKCNKLDFKLIVPELIIKPIIHPFEDVQNGAVVESDINLLRKWNSVRASVGASVRASVRDSVGASVRDSVWASVWDSVWVSVRASVGVSVRDSVRDSVGAYISLFFNLPKWKFINCESNKNPFQPCIDLWVKGLVPSFDGKMWRLHGVQSIILWEGQL